MKKILIASCIAGLLLSGCAQQAAQVPAQKNPIPAEKQEEKPAEKPAEKSASEPVVVKTTGFIEGSMSYPSEMIPPGVMVCAENTKSKVESCTKERITSSKYMYGEGYKMELPIGTYHVYERFAEKFADFTPSYRAYYSEFVTCGNKYGCPSHAPIAVTVKGGETVTGVDPQDWYAQN